LKKKVLHIINNLGSGGAESMLLHFLQHAVSNEYFEFKILLLENNQISYDIPDNVIIDNLPFQTGRFSIKRIVYLFKYLKNNNFDIIHTHLFPTQYYVALMKLFFKKTKFITTEHNTTNTRRKFYITRVLDKLVYKQYDRIIFISKGVKKQFTKDYQIKNCKKGIVLNNGIPLEKFYNRNKKKIDPNNIKLIMVARFDVQKDHETLLKALQLLPSNYTLSLVGEGPGMNRIKDLAKTLKIEPRISFLGFRKDIPKLYKKHDIFILSSNWEGFGLVAIEAMAAGLPVIASDVPGLKEIVKDAGIIFTPKDFKSLAENILNVSNNQVLYDNLRKKGLDKAKQYDIKSLVEKTLNLYNSVLYGG